jgi:hypothetical protein
MEIESTKRVYLGDEGGGWNPLKKRPYADFYRELRHGTQKAVNAIVRPLTRSSENGQAPRLVVSNDGDPKVEGGMNVEIPLDKIDITAVNDVILLGQIAEWSFGPVDQATLDGLPDDLVNILVKEADSLYGGQGPLAKRGGGK